MEVDLTGQVAVVHGAAGRWGAAVAARLERSGARVLTDTEPATPFHVLVNAEPALIDGAGTPEVLQAVARRIDRAATSLCGNGRIVNVASVFGLVPGRGSAELAAAAAALFARTRAAALGLAARGTRVNAVAVMPEHRSHTPLGRAAEPEDAAVAALFLVAEASSYLTGEILRVDGGWSQGFARSF